MDRIHFFSMKLFIIPHHNTCFTLPNIQFSEMGLKIEIPTQQILSNGTSPFVSFRLSPSSNNHRTEPKAAKGRSRSSPTVDASVEAKTPYASAGFATAKSKAVCVCVCV